MSKSYRKDAQRILADTSHDWFAIVAQIAIDHPKAVVVAVYAIENARSKRDWRDEARRLLAADLYINAIKHCRIATGLGLKEAKDEIDRLRSEMHEARRVGG